jgi:hypothetical protein
MQTLTPLSMDHVWEFFQHYSVPLAAGEHRVEISNASAAAVLGTAQP